MSCLRHNWDAKRGSQGVNPSPTLPGSQHRLRQHGSVRRARVWRLTRAALAPVSLLSPYTSAPAPRTQNTATRYLLPTWAPTKGCWDHAKGRIVAVQGCRGWADHPKNAALLPRCSKKTPLSRLGPTKRTQVHQRGWTCSAAAGGNSAEGKTRSRSKARKPAAPASSVAKRLRSVAAGSRCQRTPAPRAPFPSKEPGKRMGLTPAATRGNSKGIRKGIYDTRQCLARG